MKYELCYCDDDGNRILVQSFDELNDAVFEMIRLTHREFRIPRWPEDEMKDLYISYNDYGLDFFFVVYTEDFVQKKFVEVYTGDNLYMALIQAKKDYTLHRMEGRDYTIHAFRDYEHYTSWIRDDYIDSLPLCSYFTFGSKLEDFAE